jgi:hypothetical protein
VQIGELMVFTEHVKIREEKFGSIIFETLREKVFVTNETGKEILKLLEQGRSQEEIVIMLKDDYATTDSGIENDVVDFITQLKERGIIK